VRCVETPHGRSARGHARGSGRAEGLGRRGQSQSQERRVCWNYVNMAAGTGTRVQCGSRLTLATHWAVPPLGLLLPPLTARRRRTARDRRDGRRRISRSSCSPRTTIRRVGGFSGGRTVLATTDPPACPKLDHPNSTLPAHDEMATREEDHIPRRGETDNALVWRRGVRVILPAGWGVCRLGIGLSGCRRKTVDLLEEERVRANLRLLAGIVFTRHQRRAGVR
jgi:hypothetical protein